LVSVKREVEGIRLERELDQGTRSRRARAFNIIKSRLCIWNYARVAHSR